METSILIAKLLGVVYLFFGVGMLIHGDYYHKAVADLLKSSPFKMFGGVLATVFGVLLVTYHNIWDGPWWVVLITIFGWIGLLKGFMYLAFPNSLNDFLPWYTKSRMPMWGVLMLVIGGIFGYYGFLV